MHISCMSIAVLGVAGPPGAGVLRVVGHVMPYNPHILRLPVRYVV